MSDPRETAAAEAERARGNRDQAQQTFIAAYRQLAWALNQECKAVAAEAAANGVSYRKLVSGAISNARNSSATWSGGAHHQDNVIEALRRNAWLDLIDDASLPALFNRNGA